MRMDRKLTLLFSLIAIVVTLCNSIYAYSYNMEMLHDNTNDTLSALGNKMLTEIEQYVQLFDYAIDELYTNVDFMNAMYAVSQEEDSWDLHDQVSMQTLMSHCLYQEPLLEDFYRVSIYSPNGFYLSNHFEKTDTVVSLSDEAKETIASLPYISQVNESPFVRHIIGPHRDPWSTTRAIPVFSAVTAVHWHGKHIGYIEVSSLLDELVQIFTVKEMDGLTAHALFEDGTQLFRFWGDEVFYHNLPESEMTLYTLEDGSERFVVRLHSKSLNIDVFIAQDIATYHSKSRELLLKHLVVSGSILIISIAMIIAISRGLTSSIRGMTKKIRRFPIEQLLDDSAGDIVTHLVTKPRDREIYELEQVFNDLILRLRKSAQNEMALRQSTLQAQLNALQAQINPHFIYNTLNIISAKGMESGNEEIMEICNQFAQMLRYALDLRSRTATLDMETLNARRYLLLAKARYEDQLEFSIDIPEDAESLLIPKLSLQPLVENALTHGFTGKSGKRVIHINGNLQNNMLVLEVRDNGAGFSSDILSRLREAFASIDREQTVYTDPADGHIGLINTYLRLRYYSNGTIQMLLRNDGGAVVEMRFPCERM